jgi:alpha-N-arabinofuranosidase
VALQPVVKGPGYASRSYGYVNTVDTSAILGKGVLHVFLVNRSLSEVAPVTIDFTGRQLEKVESAEVVSGPDAKAQNTFAQPHCIHSRPFRAVQVQDGKATVQLPALSVVALTFIAREEANG